MRSVSNDEIALRELSRFFQLAKLMQERGLASPQMPTSYVDTVWHELQERTDEYRAFTSECTGCEVSHRVSAGTGELTWVPEYETLFGKLPHVWFIEPSGTMNDVVYGEYQRTGIWRTAWDCNPYVHLKEAR